MSHLECAHLSLEPPPVAHMLRRDVVSPCRPSTVATVPLSDELKGSLRTLKPKGNLLEEHVSRMAATKQVAEKKKPKGYV